MRWWVVLGGGLVEWMRIEQNFSQRHGRAPFFHTLMPFLRLRPSAKTYTQHIANYEGIIKCKNNIVRSRYRRRRATECICECVCCPTILGVHTMKWSHCFFFFSRVISPIHIAAIESAHQTRIYRVCNAYAIFHGFRSRQLIHVWVNIAAEKKSISFRCVRTGILFIYFGH